jgi:hypothetical protein
VEELTNIPTVKFGEATCHRSNCTCGGDQGELHSQNQDKDEARPPAYTERATKIPIPIQAITAFKNESIDPLDLILAVKTATNDFDDAHKDAEGKESSEDATAVE